MSIAELLKRSHLKFGKWRCSWLHTWIYLDCAAQMRCTNAKMKPRVLQLSNPEKLLFSKIRIAFYLIKASIDILQIEQ